MSNSTRDIDQLSERKKLPEGWRWVKLGDVCNKHTGIRDPRLEPDTTFQYVDISSVCNSKKCVTVAKSILGKDAPSRARQIIRFNDVIVATTRPNLNAVAQVPIELDNQICSTGFCVLRAGESIFPEYLFAFVRYQLFVDALSDLVQGALYPAVNDGQVLAQHIPLPPLPEQQRIAAILKEQMGAVEKARMAAQERLRAIKALPAAFLRQIFPDPGQPLPEGWRWAKLGEVCEVIGGSTPDTGNSAYWNGDIAWVTPTDLGKFTDITILATSRQITLSGLQNCGTQMLPVGTVIMSSRAPIGHLAIAGVSLCTNQGCKSFVPGMGVDSVFLYWAIKRAVPDIQALGSGATFAEVSKSILYQFEIPLPTLPEQQRIAAILREQLAAIEQARIAAEAELKAINTLPAALLRRAFNGEL